MTHQKRLNVAVFASGSGSNFQSIVDQMQAGKLPINMKLLICDRPQAQVVDRARSANVPVFLFRPQEYASREAYEQVILKKLHEHEVELVVLAGYMRLLTHVLVDAYAGRIINIHPSLLPAFPGLDGIGQALEYGVKVTGVTVHFVDGGLDSGPVIAQQPVVVSADDDAARLATRIHKAEHELYPKVIRWIAEGRVTMTGRHVQIERE